MGPGFGKARSHHFDKAGFDDNASLPKPRLTAPLSQGCRMIAAPDISSGKTMGMFGTLGSRILFANGIQNTGDIALARATAQIAKPSQLWFKIIITFVCQWKTPLKA
tara:strand:- start:971 stop:1291 length:321 start_codon:yes stop_codon:yes gene_type:complete